MPFREGCMPLIMVDSPPGGIPLRVETNDTTLSKRPPKISIAVQTGRMIQRLRDHRFPRAGRDCI